MTSKQYYSQPAFYHFSESSIQLSHYASEKVPHALKVLDLFSGCGVVGSEYFFKNQNLNELWVCEYQQEFMSHLKTNLDYIKNVKIMNTDFRNIEENDFDLILGNPPFYDEVKVRLSPNQNRNKCLVKSFSWEELFSWCLGHLKKSGELIFLLHKSEKLNNLFNEISKKNSLIVYTKNLNKKEYLVHMSLNIE